MKHIKGKTYIGSLKCTKSFKPGPFSKGQFYDCYEEESNSVWVVSYAFQGSTEGYRFYYGRVPLRVTNNFIDFFDTLPLERKRKLKRLNDNIRETY